MCTQERGSNGADNLEQRGNPYHAGSRSGIHAPAWCDRVGSDSQDDPLTRVLAAHQPDLFPYSGFWFKMANADVFDIAIHDQFQDRGYQRRVKMRDRWASIPIRKPGGIVPIKDVRLARGARDVLWDLVEGRHRGSRFWRQRSEMVKGWFMNAPTHWLWEFNLHMIMAVKDDLLGLPTPLIIVDPPKGRQLDGIIDLCRQHRATQYISGQGGKAYMGENPEAVMREAGIDLWWVNHDPVTPDSVLTILFDLEEPAAAILQGEIVSAVPT